MQGSRRLRCTGPGYDAVRPQPDSRTVMSEVGLYIPQRMYSPRVLLGDFKKFEILSRRV